jgi:hypothetical protein
LDLDFAVNSFKKMKKERNDEDRGAWEDFVSEFLEKPDEARSSIGLIAILHVQKPTYIKRRTRVMFVGDIIDALLWAMK